jgi:hydrogenase-4 membrane subunit HyfE
MAELAIVLAGAVLLLSTRTVTMLAAYVVLAVTVSIFVAPTALQSPLSLALFAVSTILKVIVAPLGILVFVRANPQAGNLRPSIAAPARLALVLAFALVSRAAANIPSLAAAPLEDITPYVILCGVGILIVHRNLLSHVAGLLVLGTGVTLAGAVLAPTLPESLELGATFDALVATFIGLALVRAFFARSSVLDVEALRSLRG